MIIDPTLFRAPGEPPSEPAHLPGPGRRGVLAAAAWSVPVICAAVAAPSAAASDGTAARPAAPVPTTWVRVVRTGVVEDADGYGGNGLWGEGHGLWAAVGEPSQHPGIRFGGDSLGESRRPELYFYPYDRTVTDANEVRGFIHVFAGQLVDVAEIQPVTTAGWRFRITLSVGETTALTTRGLTINPEPRASGHYLIVDGAESFYFKIWNQGDQFWSRLMSEQRPIPGS